jgi:hypothetical protein
MQRRARRRRRRRRPRGPGQSGFAEDKQSMLVSENKKEKESIESEVKRVNSKKFKSERRKHTPTHVRN